MKFFRHLYYQLAAVAFAALIAVAGCSHDSCQTCCTTCQDTKTGAAAPVEDENGVIHFTQEQAGVLQPGQRVFNSPEEAAAAFKEAVIARDRRSLVALFGDEGKVLVCSGDRVQEDNDLQAAGDRMREYLHIDRPSDTTAVIREGKENWPFAIPIVKGQAGWFFDVVAGRDELLNRRIGEDELNAIEVCRSYVAAQKEYASRDRMGDGVHQYAQHLMSHPGKKDGLYWEPIAGGELSPFGLLVAEARLEGYPATRPADHKPHPYQGYIFHILTAQGKAAPGGEMGYLVDGKLTRGFAMVASPSAYGASGIMTFIVAQDGKVFQKNLGEKTRDAVKAMTQYNPDEGWEEVKD